MAGEQKYLLALNRHPKLGARRLRQLFEAYQNWQKVWQAPRPDLAKKIGPEIVDIVLEARAKFDPEHEEAIVKKLGIEVLEYGEPSYPPMLAEVPDAPVVLYAKGDVSILKKEAVAIVGSRRATPYGIQATQKIVGPLARQAVIVSGLALGIDAAAHLAALDADGLTVGVLGCGLDRIYPTANVGLACRMLEKGGAIISEFAAGMPSYRFNFPVRNRIIAGLSQMTVVVEALIQSGALITARAALEYNRDVGAVPGDITRPQAEGCNQLIKEGAAPITSAADVAEALGWTTVAGASQNSTENVNLTGIEKDIFEKLTFEPQAINAIAKELALDIAQINSTLVMLEIKGLVQCIGGNLYVKTIVSHR